MRYKKISDYGIVGNLISLALIGLDGSIDWLCLPHVDSPCVFAALLDADKGGRFSLAPTGGWDSTAEYLPGTNILKTRFRTPSGELQVTDFMPLPAAGREYLERDSHELYRLAEVTRGSLRLAMVFDPRFDYGRARRVLEPRKGALAASGGGAILTLAASRSLSAEGPAGRREWEMHEGDRLWFPAREEPGRAGGCSCLPAGVCGRKVQLRTGGFRRRQSIRQEEGSRREGKGE